MAPSIIWLSTMAWWR